MSLTLLGIFHTIFALAAIILGIAIFFRSKQILISDKYSQTYLVLTVLAAATSLGIFQHAALGLDTFSPY